MHRLSVGIIDLVAKAPTKTMWMRIMGANFVSIMPQVVAAWCEEQGHIVILVTYTGREDLRKELPQGIDLVFIDRIRRDLGEFWDWLPEGAISHDPNAYLRSVDTTLSTRGVLRVGVA